MVRKRLQNKLASLPQDKNEPFICAEVQIKQFKPEKKESKASDFVSFADRRKLQSKLNQDFSGSDDAQSDNNLNTQLLTDTEMNMDNEFECDSEDEKLFDEIQNELIDNNVDELERALTVKFDLSNEEQGVLDELTEKVDPRVLQLYLKVRDVLCKFKSGKLPKPFKVLPQLKNWERLIVITRPDKWTAPVISEATKLFSGATTDYIAYTFYNTILLPRLLDDLQAFKKLNFHLYSALKKSTYRPAMFYNAIIIPVCENGDCTLRDAITFSSVITKSSIPVIYSAAALYKISKLEYNGASIVIMKAIVEKKYSLPYRAVDAVVDHFLNFMNDKQKLPVLWHQFLLSFVEIYGDSFSIEQKKLIIDLIKLHKHQLISTEILKKLNNHEYRQNISKMNVD
ncbi:hypothetical protein A3Q56_01714 [Intoshia linei]|uniref:Bystin n=1 Tax=Intoshia linei TaxID=1819745 RepID=A0A177B8D2_9BILA|nr:hypothetical protein A3Q56_01714 [Intoshia linei]